MILTQEQAADCGCPLRPTSRHMTISEMGALFRSGDHGNGVMPTLPSFAPCVHEACMAWRWEDPALDNRKFPDSYRSKDGPGHEPRGYCGMAGVPTLLKE